MMTPRVDRLTKGRKIALCTIIAAFASFLVVGTTWGGRGARTHTSPTGQCTVCHGTTDLKTIHQEAWSTDRTGCYICHSSTRRGSLYDYLAGASFDCLSCHNLSGAPVYYHMNVDVKHTSTEAFCMQCHSDTGTFAKLDKVHELLTPTVDCPSAVSEIEDDIYCYCLECHANPARIPALPDNANCTSCHEAGDYNPTLTQCPHDPDKLTSHEMCTNCHLTCE